jgi:hypothetical protein
MENGLWTIITVRSVSFPEREQSGTTGEEDCFSEKLAIIMENEGYI